MYEHDDGNKNCADQYLGQCHSLSKNIVNLHVPQCLYIPGSEPLLDAIDPILLADHPENIELFLPSAFPPASCNTQCAAGLPELEYQLRCAQTVDTLHNTWNFLRMTRIVSVKKLVHIMNS